MAAEAPVRQSPSAYLARVHAPADDGEPDMEQLVLLAVILTVGFLGGTWATRIRRRQQASFERAFSIAKTLFRASDDEYLTTSHVTEWHSTHGKELALALAPLNSTWLTAAQRQALPKLQLVCSDPAQTAAEWNEAFVERRIASTQLLDTRGRPLSRQQRLAVVRDDSANLIVAGAGSGKTETIVAKVSYLIRQGLAAPGEILVLAYGKKAANELGERLAEAGAQGVQTSTFHAIGFSILGKVEGEKPPVSALGTDDRAALNLIG